MFRKADLFELRTLYNFRKRVREYPDTHGVNLYQRVFEQVTDEQLEALSLERGWQRMDSTQVLSNLARMTRLELIVSMIQVTYRELDKADQERWRELIVLSRRWRRGVSALQEGVTRGGKS